MHTHEAQARGRATLLSPPPRCPQTAPDGRVDLSAPPPFSLADLRNAIPGARVRGGAVSLHACGRERAAQLPRRPQAHSAAEPCKQCGGAAASAARPPPSRHSLAPTLIASPHPHPRLRAEPCWQKDTFKSFAYLALDVGIVAGLAVLAHMYAPWFAWPLYWFAQGTMFWALFVVGHDW